MSHQGIQIFIPGGDPKGIKIVELNGWTGKTFIVPRGKLNSLKPLESVSVPAIYLLTGNDQASIKDKIYIGETDNFLKRLLSHGETKDFWNNAIVFSGSFDKADVKYLENKSIQLAKEVGRYDVINSNEPGVNTLSEFKRAAVENYFNNMQFVLSILGYSIFERAPTESTSKRVYTFSDVRDKSGNGRGSLLEDGSFIVYKGSLARIKEKASFDKRRAALRNNLLEKRIITKIDDNSYMFTQDYIFTSPSAASDAIVARSTNGWDAWKDEEGKTLDENVRK